MLCGCPFQNLYIIMRYPDSLFRRYLYRQGQGFLFTGGPLQAYYAGDTGVDDHGKTHRIRTADL